METIISYFEVVNRDNRARHELFPGNQRSLQIAVLLDHRRFMQLFRGEIKEQ